MLPGKALLCSWQKALLRAALGIAGCMKRALPLAPGARSSLQAGKVLMGTSGSRCDARQGGGHAASGLAGVTGLAGKLL